MNVHQIRMRAKARKICLEYLDRLGDSGRQRWDEMFSLLSREINETERKKQNQMKRFDSTSIHTIQHLWALQYAMKTLKDIYRSKFLFS